MATGVPRGREDVFPRWLAEKLAYFARQHHPDTEATYINYSYDRLEDFGTPRTLGEQETGADSAWNDNTPTCIWPLPTSHRRVRADIPSNRRLLHAGDTAEPAGVEEESTPEAEDERPPICPACGVTMGIVVDEHGGTRYVCLECGFSDETTHRLRATEPLVGK